MWVLKWNIDDLLFYLADYVGSETLWRWPFPGGLSITPDYEDQSFPWPRHWIMMLDKTRQDYVYVGDNQSILQK